MGSGYELKCKKCGYERPVRLGIGFSYPKVCARILDAMKSGKYGKHFMEDAQNTPHAAVHQEYEVFVCDQCGEWRVDETIDLCAPIGEFKKREGKFSVAVDCPKDVQYVMTFDIGREYKIIRSKQHRCSKCHHVLRPKKRNEMLKCPECGDPLKQGYELNWD